MALLACAASGQSDKNVESGGWKVEAVLATMLPGRGGGNWQRQKDKVNSEAMESKCGRIKSQEQNCVKGRFGWIFLCTLSLHHNVYGTDREYMCRGCSNHTQTMTIIFLDQKPEEVKKWLEGFLAGRGRPSPCLASLGLGTGVTAPPTSPTMPCHTCDRSIQCTIR